MQQKRASLSAVLEAVKQSPGSPSSWRSNRSLGPSTAPTAASTRSWLSSNADDDSFCYSETSFEDSPKESSIEFIIDTEDSDLSLTTKEEVQDALGTIYDEVIPEALKLAKKQARKEAKKQAKKEAVETATKKTTTTTSWTFQTQSSARNLYREESFRVSKSEKKKRRIKISDKKKALQSDQRQSSRSDASWASGVETIDLNQVRKQRSRLQEMMDSISELKDTEGPAPSRTRSSRSIRRLRQDDASEGSAPISSKSSRKKAPSSAPVENDGIKVDFDLSAMKEQSRRKKNASSSLASHYVIETKVKRGHKKKVVVKPAELYRAPIPDPAYLKSDSSSSEASLLASPNLSYDENDDEESLLVSPQHSEDEKSASEPAKMEESESTNPEVWLLEPPKNDLFDLTHPDVQSRGSVDNRSPIEPVVDYECDQVTTEFQSAESALMIFQEYKISQDEPAPILGERRFSTVAVAPENRQIALFSTVSQTMERTPIEPRTGSTPPSDDDLTNYMKTFTMDDIVREMNLIAAKIGKDGLKIPTGTVIKLRHNDGEEDGTEDESVTGWTFAEPSDISTCSYTLPRTASTRCAPDSSTVDSPGKPPARSSLREKDIVLPVKSNPLAEQDITERYCGGMYHLAMMTGMPAYERQEV
jgi:hypothetical protein